MPSPVLANEFNGLDWQRVASSNVSAVAYVPDFARLWVRFKEGTYVYLDVPPSVYAQFLAAGSKGQFVHRVLKGHGFGYLKFA
jgi:hypothetical protein